MGITEDIADKLAQETIAAAEQLGDDNLIAEVGRLIGAGSVTTQEAFMTAVRVRISEKRARRFLQEQLARGPKDPSRGPIELGTKLILDSPDDGVGH